MQLSCVSRASSSASVSLAFAPRAGADVYDVSWAASKSSAAAFPLALQTFIATTACNAIVCKATISMLPPNAALWFKVRAHAGPIGVQADAEWSNFTSAVQCRTTTSSSSAGVVAAARTVPAATRMYRVSEVRGIPTRWAPPDFLLNHNSADANGSASFLTFAEISLIAADGNMNSTTVTEYCVDHLSSATAAATADGDSAAEWAPYFSCPAGGVSPPWDPSAADNCSCPHYIDRWIQHSDTCCEACPSELCGQQWQNVIDAAGSDPCLACDGTTTCNEQILASAPLCHGCSDAAACEQMWARAWSEQLKTQHSGSGYPMCNCTAATTRDALLRPGRVELQWPPGVGVWYTTPAAGFNRTWRRRSRARIVYGWQLAEAGFVRTTGNSVMGQNLVSRRRHEANGVALQNAFAQHPLPSEC